MSKPVDVPALVEQLRRDLNTIGQMEIADADPRREQVQAAFAALADGIDQLAGLVAAPALTVPMRQVGETVYQRQFAGGIDGIAPAQPTP